VIIGLVGRFCAGKNTVAQILRKDYGFHQISTRDILKEEFIKELTRVESVDNLREFANQCRERYGAEAFFGDAFTIAENGQHVVISDLFCVGEVEAVLEHGGRVIVVECGKDNEKDLLVRWKRYQYRIDTSHYYKDIIEFENHDTQNENLDITETLCPNISEVMKRAEYGVWNNDSLQSLSIQLDGVLKEIDSSILKTPNFEFLNQPKKLEGQINYELEKKHYVHEFLDRYFTGEGLSEDERNLASLSVPSQSLTQLSNQMAFKLTPIFLLENAEDSFKNYKSITPSTTDEELVLLLNKDEFNELHADLHANLTSNDLKIREGVRWNLGIIRKQNIRQFHPQAMRGLDDVNRGIPIQVPKKHFETLREFVIQAGDGEIPITELCKKERIIDVNQIKNSKVSTVIHDVIDHAWLFTLLREKGLFVKYKDFFESIGEPQFNDIYKREAEAIASIGFGVRLWADVEIGFTPIKPIAEIADLFQDLMGVQFDPRHSDALKKITQLTKNPLSRESQCLSFTFSNYLVELNEQRRKHGEIRLRHPVDKSDLGILDPEKSLDYLSFFIETHSELHNSKNRHRDHLLRAHIQLEQRLIEVDRNQNARAHEIFPLKLFDLNISTLTLPPARVKWMAKNFGFTARRDPAIYL